MGSNINTLKTQAEILLGKLEGKRFVLGDLHNRLKEASQNYPSDTVICAVARVIEKMKEKNPNDIISQGKFEKIFQELVGLNASGTKFREVLGDLLITELKPMVSSNDKFISTIRDNYEKEPLDFVNSELKKEFDVLFSTSSNKYNPHLTSKAKSMVEKELISLGFDRSRVNFAGGNSEFLVFTADLDTNRGTSRIIVPVESSGEKFPEVFIANNKVGKLTKSNIITHLKEASNKGVPNISEILNTSVKDVEASQVKTPTLLKPLVSELEESLIETAIGFPQATVRLAKQMVINELHSMGFKGSQAVISEPTIDGFICKVSINTSKGKTDIEVPIEIKNNNPLMPSVFASGDYVADFNERDLKAFAISLEGNTSRINCNYNLYEMDIPQLKEVIVRSAVRGDFNSCEEALDVIADVYNEEIYRKAVNDYGKLLTGIKQSKENIKQSYDDSNQFVKTPNSIYPIHKKLGRPINELVRDENGNYHLKSTYYSRKNGNSDELFFTNAKILLGD